MKNIKQILDYATTYPYAIVTYRYSGMIPEVHSDAYYPSETNAKSRAGGHFFISSYSPEQPNNVAILTIAKTIKK